MKHTRGTRLLSILLTLAMLLSLFSGLSLTAYADGTTYNPASTYTGFGDLITNDTEVTISEVSGQTWYVIAYDSSTVTLLSKSILGAHVFNSNLSAGNVYANSEIKTYVDGLTGEGQPLAGISSVISDLTLIDAETAQGLSATKREGAGDASWWLCTPSISDGADDAVAYVSKYDNWDVKLYDGAWVSITYGVRPALKLDLSKVEFDSATNTFALPSASAEPETPTAPAAVSFVKVTDADQISVDNIGECTFDEAKAWVYDNWDSVTAGVGNAPFIAIVYIVNGSARMIFFQTAGCTDKDEFKALIESDSDADLDEIKSYYNSGYNSGYDFVYVCSKAAAPAPGAYADYVPAEADDATALAAKVVKFSGRDWYLIEDNSTGATEGTVTLFAADTSFGATQFNPDINNKYSASTVKTYLDGMTETGGAFADVADAIETVTVTTDNDTDVTAKLYLLSKSEAGALPANVRMLGNFTNADYNGGVYWLRSPNPNDSMDAACVNSLNGTIFNAQVYRTFGVRPALKLDLSKVEFDSTSKAFSLKSSHTGVILDADQIIETTQEISGDVTVVSDITVTVSSGVVLTVNGGINANGKTVTVKGPGTLVIHGATGSNGAAGYSGTDGEAGGDGFTGNIIVDGATVTVTGGTGGIGGFDGTAGFNGGSGGNGVEGNVTVISGSIEVTGGTGGNGGDGEDEGGSGGNGGIGVNGTVTVTGGSAALAGGTGGNAGYGFDAGENGGKGKAVSGTITGSGVESDDGNNWAAVSGATSTKQYVRITRAHTHNFTYAADGATITATCSADGCTLDDGTEQHNHAAFITLNAPESLTYDGSGKPVTVTFSNNFESLLPVFFDDPEITLDTIRGNICYYKNGDKNAEPSEDAIAIAGTHTAELSFKGQTAGVTYTIAKADPTCTAPTGLTATYGDTLADVALPTGWTWADNTASVGNAGTNTFKANFTPEDTANYNTVNNIDVTVTVAKKEITVSGIKANNKVYDGNYYATIDTSLATISGALSGDTLTVSADASFSDKNVAEDKTVYLSNITLGGESASNYTLASSGQQETTTASITPKGVTISGITANSKVYDGTTAATINYTSATIQGMVSGDDLSIYTDFASSHFADKNVGNNKTVTISYLLLTGSDAANYTVGSVTVTANITAKEVGLEWSNTELTYNGKAQKPTATATGLAGQDTCTVTVVGEQTNAGDNYTATAQSLSNSNYKLPENKTTAFKINKASQTAPAAPTKADATVDSITLTAITNGEYKCGAGDWQTSPTFTGLAQNTSYTFRQRYAADANHNASAGSEETVIRTNNHSHAWSFSATGATITATCTGTGTCSLTNNQISVTLVAPAGNVYNGSNHVATLDGAEAFNAATGMSVSDGDIVYNYKAKSGDSSYVVTETKNAGIYQALYTLQTNFPRPFVGISFTINKADPTATAPTATATYGDTLADVTLTNPEGNTAGTWAWTIDTATSVGNAGSNVFAATFTPDDTTNYNSVENVNVTVTVGKATPTYTVPTGLTATYGDTLSSVALPTGWAWTNGAQSVGNAGSNTFTATFTPTDTDNYNTVENVNVTVTVGKATPTYTVPTGLTATYGDTLSSVALPTGWAWTNGAQSVGDAGSNTFTATFTPMDTDNYNSVENVNVTVTVAPASVTLTANSGTETYDTTEKTVEGFTASVDGLTFDGVAATVSATNAGIYDVAFTGVTLNETKDSTGNYVVTATTAGKLTIGKAPLTIKALNQDMYTRRDLPDLSNPELDVHYTVEGLIGEDTLTAAPTLTYQKDNEAIEPETNKKGTYDIVPSDAVADNYAITYENGTLTIKSRSSAASSTTVTVPVSGDKESVNVKIEVTNNTATVKESDVGKVLGAEKVGTVTIDASGVQKSVNEVLIPGAMVEKIADAVADEKNDADGMEVKLPSGSVTFDADAVAAIAEKTNGKDLTLHLDDIRVTALNRAQQNATKELEVEVVLDAYLTSGGQRISDFKGGSATVKVPYTLKSGQTAAGLVVWYVANDGSKTQMPARYVNNEIVFTVSHFSNYVIAYDAERAKECPKNVTCPISAFTDAQPTAWYHDGVHFCLENGMMNGIGNGKFNPNGTTSRAMIVTILYRLENSPKVTAENPFTDVADGKWYTDAVIWASENKIVEGYGDGTFKPDGDITREQLAAIIYRYAQSKGQGFTGSWMFLLDYPDASAISSWADEAMHWCVMNGIINGKDGKLVPGGDASRAEAATMLWRFCTKTEK